MIREEREIALKYRAEEDVLEVSGPKLSEEPKRSANALIGKGGGLVGLDITNGHERVAWMIGAHEDVERLSAVELTFETRGDRTVARLSAASTLLKVR